MTDTTFRTLPSSLRHCLASAAADEDDARQKLMAWQCSFYFHHLTDTVSVSIQRKRTPATNAMHPDHQQIHQRWSTHHTSKFTVIMLAMK